MKMYRKISVCPKCKGEGSTIETTFAGHSTGWEHHTITCTKCNGSGLIRRTITITEEFYPPQKV